MPEYLVSDYLSPVRLVGAPVTEQEAEALELAPRVS